MRYFNISFLCVFACLVSLTQHQIADGQIFIKPSNISEALRNPGGVARSAYERATESIRQSRDNLAKDVESAGRRLEQLERDIRNLNPRGISEQLWGEAGRIAYPSAAKIMQARSPDGEKLGIWLKAYLHAEFGDLVEKVRIHWGVSPLNEWAASKCKIPLAGVESAAQTYGYDIYVKNKKPSELDSDTIELIAHEMQHSRQFEMYSRSYSEFGYHYFRHFKKANQNYENNKLEIDAREIAEKVMKSGRPAILDANGGGRFYLNSNFKDNDNYLFKITQHGENVVISPKVKKSVAFDSNGGKELYFGYNKLPNDNILWSLRKHGNFVAIVSLVKRNGSEVVAWDSNGTGKNGGYPYLNILNLDNHNMLWSLVLVRDGYFQIMTRVREK